MSNALTGSIGLPRLGSDQVVAAAHLRPIPAGAQIAPQFARDGDALQHLVSDGETSHQVAWPDGSVGFVVFWPGDDQSERLVQVYEVARALLESQTLHGADQGGQAALH